jgi:hypothetical protein
MLERDEKSVVVSFILEMKISKKGATNFMNPCLWKTNCFVGQIKVA